MRTGEETGRRHAGESRRGQRRRRCGSGRVARLAGGGQAGRRVFSPSFTTGPRLMRAACSMTCTRPCGGSGVPRGGVAPGPVEQRGASSRDRRLDRPGDRGVRRRCDRVLVPNTHRPEEPDLHPAARRRAHGSPRPMGSCVVWASRRPGTGWPGPHRGWCAGPIFEPGLELLDCGLASRSAGPGTPSRTSATTPGRATSGSCGDRYRSVLRAGPHRTALMSRVRRRTRR